MANTEQILELASKGGTHVVFQITGEELMNLLRLVADNAYQAKNRKESADILHTADREHTYTSLCTPLRQLFDKGELSVRSYWGLENNGIRTLGMLCQTSTKELRKRIRNFGNVSCDEVNTLLGNYGLRFDMDVSRYGYQKAEWQKNGFSFVKEE